MRNPITQEGFDKLTAELEKLKGVERPAIIQAIADARAHGDLSENAEYHSAKEKQGYIEARIRLLDGVLSTSDIFHPATVGGDGRCLFGSYVDLRGEDGARVTYRLVGQHEADVDKGLLSSASPIGRALIGKYTGDSVAVQTPGGEKVYELLAVRYE